jgi:hypothetical protein
MAGYPAKDMGSYGPIRVRTKVPTKQQALRVIGGKKALADVHAETAKVAAKAAGNRLQFAVAITGRHFACDTEEDLRAPATAGMSVNDRAHMAFDLNNEDGPWAVFMSNNVFAWATVTVDDLASLKIVQDFINCVYGHLR